MRPSPPTTEDSLALQRGHMFTWLLLLLAAVTAVLTIGNALFSRNAITTILNLAVLALLAATYALHQQGQSQLAVQIALAGFALMPLSWALVTRSPVPAVYLASLVVVIAAVLERSIATGVTLRRVLAPNLPEIEADASQISQVLLNLVVNASEAIGDAAGAITITTSAHHPAHAAISDANLAPDLPAGEYVYLEVADTGYGMDAATQARMFEPFFTTKFTGRGLGLAAVQGIVRGHGGALRVASAPGRGATVTVILPAAEPPIEAPGTE